MKYQPLVSIIIGNHNYECFLQKSIDSALNQTYKNIEVIVVDDGSTDSSQEIISNYGDRIISIFKENGGQPSNYNAGFAASKGDIICFLDSDDLFTSNKIEKIVSIYNLYKDISWCFHSLTLIDDKDNLLNSTTTVNYVSTQCDYRQIIKAGKIPPSLPPSPTLTFKRSLLEKILPMPTTKKMPGSDHYVKIMAAAFGKGFILAEDLTLQRIHANNMGTLRTDKLHMRAREFLLTGYWVKQQFPEFTKIANKLVAVGAALNFSFVNHDIENRKLINEYLFSSSLWNQLKILSIIFYNYIKNRLKNDFFYNHLQLLPGEYKPRNINQIDDKNTIKI